MRATLALAALAFSIPAHADGGVIRGSVSYNGPAPARELVDKSSDGQCSRSPARSEHIVVSSGKLRDVHVSLKSGTAGKHRRPSTAVQINQRDCMYRPRVVGVMAGQPLSVSNGDQTFHNVHVYIDRRTVSNRGQPAGSKPLLSNAAKPGDVMVFRCDVHPWMRAYAVVTDHPFFDVTGDDGSYSIEGIEPGSYELRAFHPKLGIRAQRVRVAKGKPLTINFDFSRPGR